MLPFLMMAKANAQDYKNHATPVTWLGIDCSHMKFLKADESTTESDLQHKYFRGWNDLMIQEKDKFDLAKATGHTTIDYDIDEINSMNENAAGPFMTNNNSDLHKFSESDIASFVKNYKISKSGVGLVFIVESFSKNNEEANIWVTYIDMSTKAVLKTVRMTEEPGGFGFRNYWAGAINKVLKNFPI